MVDTSTANVERMAISMEREIRKITKIDDLKSNEAEMLRDLARERDAARAEIERLSEENARAQEDIANLTASLAAEVTGSERLRAALAQGQNEGA